MTNDKTDITTRTLADYTATAERFWQGTKDHDVSQNVTALLDAIEGDGSYTILDFGCGPGRDLLAFQSMGHIPVGLDAMLPFVEKARAMVGCEVWQQNFLSLDLPDAHFDGVFANASLFHVPSADLLRVLSELHATLKPRGVLFASNPRGGNQEGWNGARYGAYHDEDAWSAYCENAGFTLIDHYYRPPGLPREQQPWLATVWRKI